MGSHQNLNGGFTHHFMKRWLFIYYPVVIISMMKRGFPLLITLLLIMLIFLPSVPGQEVTVFGVDEHTRTVEGGESTTFQWVVYNNGTSHLIIQPSIQPSSGKSWSGEITPQFLTLKPNESGNFTLQITVERTTPSQEVDIAIIFNSTRMDLPKDSDIHIENVHLSIISLFGTKAGENKIFGIWENFLPPPLDTNYGAFIITLIGWIIIALIFAYVIDPLIHHFTSKTETDLDDRVLRILRTPLFLLIISYGAVSSLEILNIPEDIIALLEILYQTIVIVIMAWISYRVYDSILVEFARRYSRKTQMKIDDTLVPILQKIGMVIIPLIALAFIFDLYGYDLTVFLAGAGLMGLVIAFAAQDTLSNFFAGLAILIDQPFKVGDLIMLDGDVCEVRHIGMRSTKLYNTFKSEEFVLPNNDMASRKIVNLVKPDLKYKTNVEVGVAYGSDLDLVERLIMEAAMEHPNVLKDPGHEPFVRFTQFGDSALIFKLFVWVDNVNNQWRVAHELRKAIDAKFRQHNIEIPFPQRTVWLHNIGNGS